MAAALFYGTELGLGGDAGDGLRCVGSFAAGLFLRAFIPVEQLVGS